MSAQDDEARLTARAIERLDAAQSWVITDGITTLKDHGPDAVKDMLFDRWTVLQRASPILDQAGIVAQFRLKARGISYDIQSLYQAAAGQGVYDFWMVQKSAADWAGGGAACTFVVTSAHSATGRRAIVQSSPQFIATFETPDGETVTFPQDDPAVLYDLRAWQYPACFPDSDLPGQQVIMDDDGAFKTQPYKP